jgi:hypothetical protein
VGRLELEIGTVFRELGPKWADRTEKHLERAVAAFEAMGCPVDTAEALGELAVYWRLLGEDDLAAEYLRRGEALCAGADLEARRRRLQAIVEAAGR